MLPDPLRPRRAATLAAGALAACGDPSGPSGPTSPVALEISVAAAAPAAQRGFEVAAALRDGRRIRHLRVFVDSGTAGERRFFPYYSEHSSRDTARALVYAPGPGRHRFTVVVTDTAETSASVSFERAFAFADAPYTAAALPDLGAGANALALNARGDVAGWVRDAQGRPRPAVWRGGTLNTFAAGADDTTGAVATRINGAGDVLLQLAVKSWVSGAAAVRVRRADGAVLTVGPIQFHSPVGSFDACCHVAADLSEDRRAVGASPGRTVYARSAVLDVAMGTLADSAYGTVTALATGGRAAGYSLGGYHNAGAYLFTHGLTAPPPLVGRDRAPSCDYFGRYSRTIPVDLDEGGNLLVTYCGAPAYLPHAGAGTQVWVDRLVGPGRARLSREGGLVASLDTLGGAIWLWRVGTAAAERVRLAGDGWRVDSLGAVNAAGQIAAQGVERATGRRAALLLTPASR